MPIDSEFDPRLAVQIMNLAVHFVLVRMPAGGGKRRPKNPQELSDDNKVLPEEKQDCGQPGFTPSERGRFSATTFRGGYLHKEQDTESGFSWSGNPIGKYRGKRMRIDYFLVSQQLKDRIVSFKMHGHGIELTGFYGSDHCPVTLELSKPSSDTEQNHFSN